MSFWGTVIAANTTIKASPSPTTTTFEVNSTADLFINQVVQVEVSSAYEETSITAIVGDLVTVSPALSSAPDVPGSLISRHEVITNTKLNNGAIFNADDIASLKAVDTTSAPNGIHYRVPENDIYRHTKDESNPVDGDLVVEPTTGGGAFHSAYSNGSRAFAWLSPDIQETLPIVGVALDFASISAQSASATLTTTVAGARDGDIVTVFPPNLPDGVFVQRAWVSDKNEVSIKLFNSDNSSQNPDEDTFNIQITIPDRIPALTARGIQFYSDLQDSDNYTDTELEADLATGTNQMHFRLLLASRQRRQNLLDDADIKSNIEDSATANEIMEDYEGAGY